MIKLKKKVKDILRVALPSMLVVILFVIASLLYIDLKANEKNPYNVSNGSFNITTSSTPEIQLYSSETVVTANNTVSQTLTATVLPENAPDKSVDWTIYWVSNPFGEDKAVTEYVTVTPQSDGSNVATVTAHKSFPNATIMIRCTTRVGGFVAECLVEYEGAPETLTLKQGGTALQNGAVLEVSPNVTNNYTLELNNTLGYVAEKYGTYTIESVVASGSFYATHQMYIGNGFTSGNSTTEKINFADYLENFFEITLTGNTLSIKSKNPVSAFRTYVDGDGYHDNVTDKPGVLLTFSHYDTLNNLWGSVEGTDASGCSILIKLKETVSGISSEVRVYISSSVSSVTLNNTILKF